jgi:hypothetical protein
MAMIPMARRVAELGQFKRSHLGKAQVFGVSDPKCGEEVCARV